MPQLKITGKDLIAISIVGVCGALIALGHNHLITYLLIGTAAGYGLVIAPNIPSGRK